MDTAGPGSPHGLLQQVYITWHTGHQNEIRSREPVRPDSTLPPHSGQAFFL